MVDLYSAVLLSTISIDDPDDVLFYEESVLLMHASSEQEATAIAERFARDAEHTYVNADGETVHWRFRELVRVVREPVVDAGVPTDLSDGVEVRSRFFGDLDAYRAAIGPEATARCTAGPVR